MIPTLTAVLTPFTRRAAIAGALLALVAPIALGARASSAPEPQPPQAATGQGAPATPSTQTPATQPPAPGTPGATPNAGPPAPSENLTPGELNRLFEAYAVLQAQNMLRLTDDQYADFIIRLRALQNVRRRHQQGRQRLLQDLRKLTNPQNTTADEATIRTTLETLVRTDATAYEEIRKAQEQVDELLDIRQRARFRVFEENLERWKLDLLSRVRRAARDKTKPKS